MGRASKWRGPATLEHVARRRSFGLGLVIAAAVCLSLGNALVVGSTSEGSAEPRGEKPAVACWNTYFPFEPEGPDTLKRPKRCLLYRDGAKKYAGGAVASKRLSWNWRNRRATALGRLDEPVRGPERFKRGRLALTKPVEACGRRMFSELSYHYRWRGRQVKRTYAIYTC